MYYLYSFEFGHVYEATWQPENARPYQAAGMKYHGKFNTRREAHAHAESIGLGINF